jgi:hypothetical protein
MKKVLVLFTVVALVALVSSSAFAERWGKPGANLAKGQSSVGVEYSYIEHTVDYKSPSWAFALPPAIVSSINGEHQEAENQVLVRLGYGLTDRLEVFLKMGGISTDVDSTFLGPTFSMTDDLNGNLEFAIIGGLTATLFESDNFRLGGQIQLGFHQLNDTNETANPYIQNIHSDVLTLEGALLASYTIGTVTPYAGLCMWIRESNADYHVYSPSLSPVWVNDLTTDQEEWLGGVLGVNCAVTDNVRVGVEATAVGEGVGVSCGVNVAL